MAKKDAKATAAGEMMTVTEVAQKLNVTPRTIQKELRAGRLNGFTRLRRWYVFEADLTDYIRKGTDNKRADPGE